MSVLLLVSQSRSTGGTNTYTGTFTNSNTRVGTNYNGSAYLTGKIAELIIFNTDETSNRTDIESNINSYYSIY